MPVDPRRVLWSAMLVLSSILVVLAIATFALVEVPRLYYDLFPGGPPAEYECLEAPGRPC